MSTKLFNGYLLKKMTLLQLQDFAMRVRETLDPIGNELYTRKMAEICANLLDNKAVYSAEEFSGHARALCGEDFNAEHGVFVAAHYVMITRENNIKKTQTRDPEFDFGCEMSIIPTRAGIFMLLYTEQERYTSAIEAMPEVTKYPYWDNSDRPSDVSSKEWRKRGSQWNKALSKHIGIPAMNGFGITCVHLLGMPDAEEVLAAIPSFEERVNRLAADFVRIRYMKSLSSAPCELMVHYMKSLAYMKTDEGKAELSKESERLRGLLKPSYTKEDLFKPD